MSHISISENRFNRFSEEDQAIILEAAQQAGVLGTDKGVEYDAELIQEFEDLGVTVTEVDKQAFIDAAKEGTKANRARVAGPHTISAPESAIPVLVVPTDEEQAIARLTWELTRG